MNLRKTNFLRPASTPCFKLLFLLLSFSISSFSFAAFENAPTYYPNSFIQSLSLNTITGDDLKDQIYQILADYHTERPGQHDILGCKPKLGKCSIHEALSYREARTILHGIIHIKEDSKGYYIRDVYCGKMYRSNVGVGPLRIPNPNKINTEHTWPKSRFSSRARRSFQLSDLHHLYPTDSQANSTRSSLYFGDVDYRENVNNCKLSYTGINYNTSGTLFEPPAEHRGNVARALFYFSIRYNVKIRSNEETFLRKWHQEDPVDSDEVRRNNIIHENQKNRNPFIDLPELVNLIKNF